MLFQVNEQIILIMRVDGDRQIFTVLEWARFRYHDAGTLQVVRGDISQIANLRLYFTMVRPKSGVSSSFPSRFTRTLIPRAKVKSYLAAEAEACPLGSEWVEQD